MVSFLEGQLRNAIAKGFNGKLLTGNLSRPGAATGVDEYGDPIYTVPFEIPVQGFVDEYNDAYRATAGIPETDSKVCLIAGLMSTDPQKDDKLKFPGFPLFQIRKIKTDPAIAMWECQSYKVDDKVDENDGQI